jgi:hypothetical protein
MGQRRGPFQRYKDIKYYLYVRLHIVGRKELLDVAAFDDHESCEILCQLKRLEFCRQMLTDDHDERERVVHKRTDKHASRKYPRCVD